MRRRVGVRTGEVGRFGLWRVCASVCGFGRWPLGSVFVFGVGLLGVGLVAGCGGRNETPEGRQEVVCGDGVMEGWEDCDGTDFGEQSCLTAVGVAGGKLSCTADCHLDVSGCGVRPECGNGVAELWEQCDGTDLGGESCESLGYGRGELGCTAGCVYDVSGCERGPECGNGVMEAGEECDGTDFGGQSCETVVGLGAGELRCTERCRLDVSGCEREAECGDGVVEGEEACDGEDFGGATCESLGHGGGELRCTEGCRLDESGCWDCGDGACEVGKGEGQGECWEDCRWVDVAAGWYHVCGALADGTVWCWGRNEHGQVGDGTRQDRYAPVRVEGLDGKVTRDPTWWYRGAGEWSSSLQPGAEHTCVLVGPGSGESEDATHVMCWGSNEEGQLGIGVCGGESLVPRPVACTYDWLDRSCDVDRGRLSGVQWVICGPYSCDADSFSWGRNADHQLFRSHWGANGPAVSTFDRICRPPEWIWDNAPYFSITTVLDEHAGCQWQGAYDSSVVCWGRNDSCIFAGTDIVDVGETLPRVVNGQEEGPREVAIPDDRDGWSPRTVQQVVAAHGRACVLLSDSTILCWGWYGGIFYLGDELDEPHYSCDIRAVPALGEPIRRIALQAEDLIPVYGFGFAYERESMLCAVTESGEVWCHGAPYKGVLGSSMPIGDLYWRHYWVQMEVPNPVDKVVLGRSYFACALDEYGHLWCTGSNLNGQLGQGDPSLDHVMTPVEVRIEP